MARTDRDEIAKIVFANFIHFINIMLIMSLNLIDMCIALIISLFQKPGRDPILDHVLANRPCPNHQASTGVRNSPLVEHCGGLHPSVLNSFPTVQHTNSSEEHCSICREKFVRREKLKLLPECCHKFHRNCITAWFRNNTTCPLCRRDYRPEAVYF
jgi:Ring finger domain